jgi:hypothetical protein
MVRPGSRTSTQTGQATVEHVAIVVVVAVLLAAIGAWIASRVRSDAGPPDVVTRVWPGWQQLEEPVAPVPDLGLRPGASHRSGIGSIVRRAVRLAGRARKVVLGGQRAFASGFGHGLWDTFTGFVRDPVGLLTAGGGIVTQLAGDPGGFARAQLEAAIVYARELSRMPPEAAYRRFMRDLGELSADVAVARGKSFAERAMLRALKRRLDARGAAPAAQPPDKRDGN